MNVYYIKLATEGVMHDTVFTTAKLAEAYLSDDTTCDFKHGVWRDKTTGEEVARITVARLKVE